MIYLSYPSNSFRLICFRYLFILFISFFCDAFASLQFSSEFHYILTNTVEYKKKHFSYYCNLHIPHLHNFLFIFVTFFSLFQFIYYFRSLLLIYFSSYHFVLSHFLNVWMEPMQCSIFCNVKNLFYTITWW